MPTSSTLRLSVLDQSPVRPGATARQALQETTQLAQLADRLGYTRYWVSEHHNTTTLAGPAPEVLLSHLGAHTSRIRLGSGGVMLPHYSALKVAENFKMLEALHPGRIDLGIGRAPGADRLTAYALNPSNKFAEEDFVEQLVDLQAYLRDERTPETIHERVQAIPQIETQPELWLLSSSGQSGEFAAQLGLGFTFAQFINPSGGPAAVRAYRQQFRPSPELAAPAASVALFVLCADTEEKANALAKAMLMQLLRFEQGVRGPYPTAAEVAAHQFGPLEQARLRHHQGRVVSGTPAQVHAQLTELAAAYAVDELILTSITADFADRLRSYELLAEAFELAPASPVVSAEVLMD
ncbi:LLM class flavin-dependent oxidoreductase [Hymenobacter cheonanensis]|uniref:LLM class flavin-dependent oxidoreductase n=1 Tax=Hymenobacter sp. CA2-7 TaxID=3063993 RepID=UPI002713893B|nr:LLM class flavin-dependent oxidoreductase [Hymenobacter sp. CA2-7]MDO7886612.1 LLM class flavin-dependent oxidoreductase [Hymenobacter sp. CA2-7]